MGFASKIAGSQNANTNANPPSNMANNSGVYGGAPPSGYTGGPPPPASLQPGGYPGQQQQPTSPPQQQYQAYPGSPSPSAAPQGRPAPLRSGSAQSPYPTSPAQPYQPYNGYSAPPVPPKSGPSPSPAPTPYSGPPPQAYSQPPYSPHSPAPQGYPPSPYGMQSPYGQPQQGYNRAPPPPPQSQPYGAPGPQYPPQQQFYGQAPSPYPQQAPPQQGSPYPGARPGAPPSGPPGPGYGAPAVTEQQIAAYKQLLIGTIQEKQLQSFYPPNKLDMVLQGLANEAPSKVNRLVHEWSVPQEVATDVMKLSLFDVILYVDDSGSIEFEEKGVRKEQLRQIISIVATAASTFDADGISVRFMNSMESGDGIRNADDVNMLVSRVRFSGLTPLGTGLKNKVLDPMVVGPARSGRLQKPVLVITITDGQPAGEPHDTVANSIHYAVSELSRTPYGRGAVSFQFSQVGNDTRARDFLGALDEDPSIGNLIDCTSNFEVEQDEMSRAVPPVYLTRELWCAKLMLGAIDSSYDTKDEKAAGRAAGAGGAPPPGPPSGGPPSAPYGGGYSQPGYYNQAPAPSPSYNQPSQYGAPGGAPGGYGQAPAPYPPSQGRPPQQYGGYGAPSQQPDPSAYGRPPSTQGATRGYPPQGGYYAPPRY